MGRPVCGGGAYARRADARGDRPADERGHRADGPPGPAVPAARHRPHGRRCRGRQPHALLGIQHPRRPGRGGNRIFVRYPHHNVRAGRHGAGLVLPRGVRRTAGHTRRALCPRGDGRAHAEKHGPRRRRPVPARRLPRAVPDASGAVHRAAGGRACGDARHGHLCQDCDRSGLGREIPGAQCLCGARGGPCGLCRAHHGGTEQLCWRSAP